MEVELGSLLQLFPLNDPPPQFSFVARYREAKPSAELLELLFVFVSVESALRLSESLPQLLNRSWVDWLVLLGR